MPLRHPPGRQDRCHHWPLLCARATRRGVKRGAAVSGPAAPPQSGSRRTAKPVRCCAPSSSTGRFRAGDSQPTQ
eukprot:2503539-Rhodomonas_salina.8